MTILTINDNFDLRIHIGENEVHKEKLGFIFLEGADTLFFRPVIYIDKSPKSLFK